MMDCSICSTMPFIVRPPRNTICAVCYEGARTVISITNKIESDKPELDKLCNNTLYSPPCPSSKGFTNTIKWIKEIKEMVEDANEKLNFLISIGDAYRNQIHSDILLSPGTNNGPPIPAHRMLLATRSEIFKNMLESDTCKAAPINDTITLPELSHEELDSLLEFLYIGTLPQEKMDKHGYALSIAADKYAISYLQRFCEKWMLSSLKSSNALDVLEISDICSNGTLKETALSFIVQNMEEIVFSARFDAFALKNPHLSVHITRASFLDIKSRSNNNGV